MHVILALLAVAGQAEGRSSLVAHEWGTYTVVSGSDGEPFSWRPTIGLDLPGFVHSSAEDSGVAKKELRGLVRMETPVIYFYSDKPTEASVRVSFPAGLITEWYPQAQKKRGGADGVIEWTGVTVAPNGAGALPGERTQDARDHYYAARETDAAVLQIGTEREKFLFYRGIGNFRLPVQAAFQNDAEGGLRSREKPRHAVTIAIRSGQGRFDAEGERIQGTCRELLGKLSLTLVRMLVAEGLYPKEARAMVGTWGESYVEEGVRVLYLVPRQEIDTNLPIDIQPQAHVVRVFVARIECVTREQEVAIGTLVERLGQGDPSARAPLKAELEKLGRFAEPFRLRAIASLKSERERRTAQELWTR